jgi:holo-[acyl-carrier protein] synthase
MITGIGTDIIEIERMRKVYERFGERFLQRVFTEGERAFCMRRADPVPGFAARFAAKEAVMKALGTGFAKGVSWRHVEVVRSPGEVPEIKLHGTAADIARKKNVANTHLSISHGREHAVAFVVMEALETE